MAMTEQKIAGHPELQKLLRAQSTALLASHDTNPRLASVFATQQRWLLGHIGLALHFRRSAGEPGLQLSRFFEEVRRHSVASRNTAHAFIREMLNYKFLRYAVHGGDRRARPMEPSEEPLDAIDGWMRVHLVTLDGLDGGSRLETYLATPNLLERMQPLICDGLLSSKSIVEPVDTFSLFTWLNDGGVIMDRLIAGIEDAAPGATQLSTDVTSMAEIAKWLNLSRTHLARKLRQAEDRGSLGWRGKRGSSVLWVSIDFLSEIVLAQAAKLAVIDAAYEATISC